MALMDVDEKDICNYLKIWAKQFVSGPEIARRAAGKKKFLKDPNWAAQALSRLVDRGVIESDAAGHYHLVPIDENEKRKRWVSPQIKCILDRSGKDFQTVWDLEEPKAPSDDKPTV